MESIVACMQALFLILKIRKTYTITLMIVFILFGNPFINILFNQVTFKYFLHLLAQFSYLDMKRKMG